LYGAGSEEHGIMSDSWTSYSEDLKPTCGDIFFPSIFEVIKSSNTAINTLAVFGNSNISKLLDQQYINSNYQSNSDSKLVDNALDFLEKNKQNSNFLFIELDELAHVASSSGFGSGEYISGLKRVDTQVGRIQQKLRALSLLDKTLIIITSDRAGPGAQTSYGCMDPNCIKVPFIMYGSNVNNSNGNTIQGYIRNLDVAATVVSALGITKLPKMLDK